MTKVLREAFDELVAESNDPATRLGHDAHVAATGDRRAIVGYLDGAVGTAQVERCPVCCWVQVLCEHRVNAWNTDGSVLTCQLCGRDVT